MLRAWLRKHKAVLGYLAIVAIAVGLLQLSASRTVAHLNRHDAISCDQRNRLAANQRAVLSALVQVVRIEVDEVGEHGGQRALLKAALLDLNRRAQFAGPEAC